MRIAYQSTVLDVRMESLRFRSLGTITRWNGDGFVVDDLDLFPGLPTADRIVRPVDYEEQLLYIAAQSVRGTSKWQPLALMSVDSDLRPKRVSLTNCQRPQDIAVSDETLFVLCNEQTGSDWYVSVQASCNLTIWQEVANFTAPTFARSFAIHLGNIYVGLGSDTNAPSTTQEVVGQVLNVPLSETPQL